MSEHNKNIQTTLNHFTRKYLRGVKALAVDGRRGEATNSRIMSVKYYLGYGEDRDADWKSLTVRRIRHPHSPKFSSPKMLVTGALRRRRQRKRATSAVAAKDDGLWGGSRYFTNRAVAVAAKHGVGISRRKWTGPPINGNWGSDHNVWNTTADAVDLPTFDGAQLARDIARALGIDNFQTGNFNNYYVTHNGRSYRIQILWAVAGHFDHVHVGVRRA